MNIRASVYGWDIDTNLAVYQQKTLPDSYVVKIGECDIFFNHASLECFTDMLRDFMQANPVASSALGVEVRAVPFNELDDEIPF